MGPVSRSLRSLVRDDSCVPLLHGHGNYARAHHAERPRGGDGEIDDPPAHERAAVVDAALNGTPAMGDGEDCAHGCCPVCTGHAAAASSIVGSETGLSVSGECGCERDKCSESDGSIHGGLVK